MEPYRLWYWPSIQGRGEFVRLALEAAGARYIDVARGAARQGAGVPALMRWMEDPDVAQPPFAPPILQHGHTVVAQTAAILQYLGPRLKLVGRGAATQLWTHQIQLTIADLVSEVHDTHHPIASSLYYEQQKPEALRRAAMFRSERLPKFIGWFESLLTRNAARHRTGAWHLVGARLSYADLSLYQLVEGLNHAFPRAAQRALDAAPAVRRLHAEVVRLPRIAEYLASPRRIPFNQSGIFRRYPELDD